MAENENLKDEKLLPDNVKMDAGSEALTNALQKAFNILKFVMLVIIVAYLMSGFFRVNSGEKALVLQLGKMTTAEPLTEGLHWTWPSPISEKIIIPVTKTQVLPIDLFWYFMTDQEKLGGKPGRLRETLVPGRDGYCLTRNDAVDSEEGADYNIVHAKWQLTYMMSRPELFFRNIYYRDRKPGEDFLDVATETVEPLLESLAANAIVSTMVKYTIDEAIVSKSDIGREVKMILQDKLREIECGITIDSVLVDGKITWPRQVDNAFEGASQARNMSDRIVTEARGKAEKLLNETGGKNAVEILDELQIPGLDQQRREQLLSRLSGACQTTMSQAMADSNRIVKAAEANALYFTSLLPEYQKRPKLVVHKIYQDAVEEVLENADEKFFFEPGTGGKNRQLRIEINRDPSIKPKLKEKN
jgi:regulator of protease activity HflC (stomatin/prohibitin superfamily)